MNRYIYSLIMIGVLMGSVPWMVQAEDASLDELVLMKAELKAAPADKMVAPNVKAKQVTPTSNNIQNAKLSASSNNEGKAETLQKSKEAQEVPDVVVKDPRTGFIWSKDRTFGSGAILRALNKITARASEFRTPLHHPLVYGNLEITVRSCWHSPPDEKPENKAFIEIWENVPGKDPIRIFFGWMLSSSPSIFGLEHPVYDVMIKECF